MSSTYRAAGLSFCYPSEWHAQEQREEDRLSVTVTGDGTAFCTVTMLYDRPDPRRVLDAAVQAFRDEYAELDVYSADSRMASRHAVGCDVDFFCLELCNTALLRAFRTGRFTVLVLFQSSDAELPGARPVFNELCRSLNCDAGVLLDGLT
jgi:hypothetical protein